MLASSRLGRVRGIEIWVGIVAVSSAGNVQAKHYLSSAQDALCVGNTLTSRRLARQAFELGMSARDRHLEAEALLVLGQVYVLESRIRLAHQLSSHACELFRLDSDSAGQAEALAIVSYSSSALGRNAEALKAAHEGLSLRRNVSSPLIQAFVLNYLGVASFWARDFAMASRTLEASVWYANHDSKNPTASFQPLVNYCCSEILGTLDSECNRPGSADYAGLHRLTLEARAMKRKGDATSFSKGAADIGFLLLDFSSCFIASRLGRREEADKSYLACLDRASRLPPNSWLQAVVWWARLERARGHGDVEKSLATARAMGEAARVGEHAQLPALAHSLKSSLTAQAYV